MKNSRQRGWLGVAIAVALSVLASGHAEFKLLTDGTPTSDRVGNDSVFRHTFPCLGAPQLPPVH